MPARNVTKGQPEQRTSKLSEAEERLVQSSRAAILATGISAAYFDRHFTLHSVYNVPGDRRVIWKFSINEYETTISDSVGYYTNERGQSVDVHTVGSALSSAHEITRTIPRRQAERAMRACIGQYTGGTVIYAAHGSAQQAALLFTASSAPRPALGEERERRERRERREQRERRERAERERREKARKTPGQQVEQDEVEEEDEGDGPAIYIGQVNLETGKCTKGLAQAGPPVSK